MRSAIGILWIGASAALAAEPTINDGYRLMYDLQFEEAHRVFSSWQQRHPEDPLGSVSDAAAYLFSELDRLRVLQAEFFLNDQGFKKSSKLVPDPSLKGNFERSLLKGEALADTALARSANDRNALFSKVMVLGLRSDYLGLIEKKYLASLGPLKTGRQFAQRLLDQDPHYGDAYLAVGVENYILSLKPAPIRWLLQAYGSETDGAKGIEKLKLCVQHGQYLKPFARLLLAVAAVRSKNYDQARELLFGLAREFPRNPLYAQQASKLPK